MEIANVRGTKDLFGEEAALFQNIIRTAQHLASRHNFVFAELPIFEFAEVFQRTMGATSDVVKSYTCEGKILCINNNFVLK